MIVGRAVGAPHGIVGRPGLGMRARSRPGAIPAGQDRGAVRRGATLAGAAAAGADGAPWRALGERLGEAYQVADDIRDVAGDPDEIGKPVGRDAALGPPERGVLTLGLDGAVARSSDLVARGGRRHPGLPGRGGSCAALIRRRPAGSCPLRTRRRLRRGRDAPPDARLARPRRRRPRPGRALCDALAAWPRPAAGQPALPALGRGASR